VAVSSPDEHPNTWGVTPYFNSLQLKLFTKSGFPSLIHQLSWPKQHFSKPILGKITHCSVYSFFQSLLCKPLTMIFCNIVCIFPSFFSKPMNISSKPKPFPLLWTFHQNLNHASDPLNTFINLQDQWEPCQITQVVLPLITSVTQCQTGSHWKP